MGSLLKSARPNFFQKFNYICRPSFHTENGYKEEICKVLGSDRIRIGNIAHKFFIFFGYYIHSHQKLLTNKKRVLFVDGSFNFSLFSRVLRVKNSCQSRSLEVFG